MHPRGVGVAPVWAVFAGADQSRSEPPGWGLAAI